MKVSGSISSASTFLDDSKKRKKKKAKKAKREKLDKQKPKSKSQRCLKDYADVCDLILFAQRPEDKKKKRKKKHDDTLNKEIPLTQNKNLRLPKRHKENKKSDLPLDTRTVQHGVRSGPGEEEAVQPILSSTHKEKKHKKRVAFNLSAVVLEPKPTVVRDIFQTQHSSTGKKTSSNAAFPADGSHGKPAMEGNATESQSTSDEVNSQDLFITQKSFSDPYIDLCSSTSPEEALEPQRYTGSCLEHQILPKKPACHPSPRDKLHASTQTENFFTSPLLATSLRSCQRITCTEEPMDLSLPKRSKLHQWEDQRHPEPSTTDLTQSDDSDSHYKSKADLSQLKVVQMRLNESFFFKLKGEVDSPKPRSPLMKFSGGSGEKKKP